MKITRQTEFLLLEEKGEFYRYKIPDITGYCVLYYSGMSAIQIQMFSNGIIDRNDFYQYETKEIAAPIIQNWTDQIDTIMFGYYNRIEEKEKLAGEIL